MTTILPPPVAPERLAQVVEAYGVAWPDPATIRIDLAALDDGSTLAAVMRRLFDPRDREQLTVSAFASSL